MVSYSDFCYECPQQFQKQLNAVSEDEEEERAREEIEGYLLWDALSTTTKGKRKFIWTRPTTNKLRNNAAVMKLTRSSHTTATHLHYLIRVFCSGWPYFVSRCMYSNTRTIITLCLILPVTATNRDHLGWGSICMLASRYYWGISIWIFISRTSNNSNPRNH